MNCLLPRVAAMATAALLTCSLVWSDAPRGEAAPLEIMPGKGSKPRAAVHPDMNAFATLDLNRDGYLAPNETDPDFCAQFAVVDRNLDGLISPTEYQLHAERRALMVEVVKAYMLREDENNDGLLSRAEFHGRPAAFVWADQDENNVLHHEELMRMIGSADTFQYDVELYFSSHDLDSDGAIVIDEWNGVEKSRELFRAIDTDRNQVLMPDEVFSFLYRYERRLNAPVVEKKEMKEKTYKPSNQGQG